MRAVPLFQSAAELALSWCLPLLSNHQPWRQEGFNSLQCWRVLRALPARPQVNNELARSNMYGCINPIKLLKVASVASIQVVAVFDGWERRTLSRHWAWFQRRQRTRPQHLRAKSPAYFSKILITYFKYLAGFLWFKFGWVVNNIFFLLCDKLRPHILIPLYTDFF